MNNCPFCKWQDIKTDCDDRVGLIGTNIMWFDNSGSEYLPGEWKINYCPLCGRKLGESEE